jgi:hypothetical protein
MAEGLNLGLVQTQRLYDAVYFPAEFIRMLGNGLPSG